jgi:hypothetical protein
VRPTSWPARYTEQPRPCRKLQGGLGWNDLRVALNALSGAPPQQACPAYAVLSRPFFNCLSANLRAPLRTVQHSTLLLYILLTRTTQHFVPYRTPPSLTQPAPNTSCQRSFWQLHLLRPEERGPPRIQQELSSLRLLSSRHNPVIWPRPTGHCTSDRYQDHCLRTQYRKSPLANSATARAWLPNHRPVQDTLRQPKPKGEHGVRVW